MLENGFASGIESDEEPIMCGIIHENDGCYACSEQKTRYARASAGTMIFRCH